MNKFDAVNQHYLLNEQYKDASNLNTRLGIIQRLSAEPVDWYQWIFSFIKPAPRCRVLELGCGPGNLWRRNLERIPPDWEITLSDFSPGMLKDAQANLSQSGRKFAFQVIDAQSIPFENAHFDRLIANLMLYHVPDRPRTFAEISRVLKPDGFFYAATVSDAAFAELEKWMGRVGMASWSDALGFSIENGMEQLTRWFSHVELHHLKHELVVTEADSLVEVIRSGTPKGEYDEATFQRLRDLIEYELAQHGPIHMNMEIGLFEATGQQAT
jgi:ubiquinone/menaquinone biosynthesis C-methylase UbiE